MVWGLPEVVTLEGEVPRVVLPGVSRGIALTLLRLPPALSRWPKGEGPCPPLA